MREGTMRLLAQAGFTDQVLLIKLGCCPICKKQICESEFTDELSKKEYDISGLCQLCQDETFITED